VGLSGSSRRFRSHNLLDRELAVTVLTLATTWRAFQHPPIALIVLLPVRESTIFNPQISQRGPGRNPKQFTQRRKGAKALSSLRFRLCAFASWRLCVKTLLQKSLLQNCGPFKAIATGRRFLCATGTALSNFLLRRKAQCVTALVFGACSTDPPPMGLEMLLKFVSIRLS
jgi:hypothetical protein